MSKAENSTRFEWKHWLLPGVCFLAAIAALVISVYVQASISSLIKRLDEQQKSLSQLHVETADEAEESPQQQHRLDPDLQSSYSPVRCVLGEGCRTSNGDTIPIPTAHLVANETGGLLLWYPEILYGGMRVSGPHMIVPFTGSYFVYCQVQHRDLTEYQYMLLVNGQPVWPNIKSHYRAGMLTLNANDSVTILPDPSVSDQLTYRSSFFGAYLFADVRADSV